MPRWMWLPKLWGVLLSLPSQAHLYMFRNINKRHLVYNNTTPPICFTISTKIYCIMTKLSQLITIPSITQLKSHTVGWGIVLVTLWHKKERKQFFINLMEAGPYNSTITSKIWVKGVVAGMANAAVFDSLGFSKYIQSIKNWTINMSNSHIPVSQPFLEKTRAATLKAYKPSMYQRCPMSPTERFITTLTIGSLPSQHLDLELLKLFCLP